MGSLRRRQEQITDFMKITSDKDAQRTDVIGRFEKVGHHYGHHASRRGRTDADVRVFQGQT